MNREVHVRLREGLRGKFPRSTRLVSVLQKELVGLDCRLPFLIHLAIRNKDGQNDKNKCP